MNKLDDWFKVKKYPHIGKPIRIKNYGRVKKYVDNPIKVSKHSFLPFIHKTIVKRRFRPDKQEPQKSSSGKRIRIKYEPKERPIFFASHLDAMIFSKYNYILNEAYENYLMGKSFNESVVAYRKIPLIKGEKGNKCNIDFAKAAFEFIKNNQDKNLTVIIADIKSFFDSLDHKILKKRWAEVLHLTSLPPDHFNLYKALTRIKYVESNQLFEAYNKTVYVERGVANSAIKRERVKKKVNSTKFFKEKNVDSYCDKREFINNNLNLIISKNNKTGIPQGSPISATLANIYLLDFDKIVYKEIENVHGFYQRYSDDLVVVCEQQYEDHLIKVIRETISGESAKLKIEPEKTKVFHFEIIDGLFKGYAIDEVSKKPNFNKPLEYLGFSFNGQHVLIKTAGFSKFYRSMKGAFNRGVSFALHSKNPNKTLFKGKLYKRFTFKGANRKLIFRPITNNPKLYKPTKEYNWGNYINYINKSNETMKSINGNDAIKRQGRKLWNQFHKLLAVHEGKLNEINRI